MFLYGDNYFILCLRVEFPDEVEGVDSSLDFSLGEEEAGTLWEEDEEEGSAQSGEGAQHDVDAPGGQVNRTCSEDGSI